MTKHTEGQLHIGPHNCVMGGPEREFQGSVVQSQLFMACAQEWMRPGEIEANARRLAACWNALLGVPTELLEDAVNAGITDVTQGNLFSARIALQKQRDELLAALVSLAAVARRYLPDYDEHPEVQKADNAIANAKGAS